MGTTQVFVTKPDEVLTREQVRKNFDEEGLTFAKWGRENHYPVSDVYKVMNELTKCKYGRPHEIAVRLRLKAGTVQKQKLSRGKSNAKS